MNRERQTALDLILDKLRHLDVGLDDVFGIRAAKGIIYLIVDKPGTLVEHRFRYCDKTHSVETFRFYDLSKEDQTALIRELDTIPDLSQSTIAQLVGTSPATVGVALRHGLVNGRSRQ